MLPGKAQLVGVNFGPMRRGLGMDEDKIPAGLTTPSGLTDC